MLNRKNLKIQGLKEINQQNIRLDSDDLVVKTKIYNVRNVELLCPSYPAYSTMHKFEYSLKVFKFSLFLQSGMVQDQLRCSVAALSLLWTWSLLLL